MLALFTHLLSHLVQIGFFLFRIILYSILQAAKLKNKLFPKKQTPSRTLENVKSVCIIGGGAAGLASLKVLLENRECYDKIVLLEKHERVGGIWDDSRQDDTPVYKHLHTNTSKQMMVYSDYIMPAEFPTFPNQSQVGEYLNSYADHFELKRYIKFSCEAVKVEKLEVEGSKGSMEADGRVPPARWRVEWKHTKQGIKHEDEFDAVMVCNGHHQMPGISPQFEELKKTYTSGKLIHSSEYKRNDMFDGKTVVVVGVGSSGAEIAASIIANSKNSSVYLSVKPTAMVSPKFFFSQASDQVLRRRILGVIPTKWKKWIQSTVLDLTHPVIGSINSSRNPAITNPGLSTELLQQLANGQAKIIGRLDSFTETQVSFDDGTVLSPDYIVVSAGYFYYYPFLEGTFSSHEDIQLSNDRVSPLYEHIFHGKYPSLTFIGIPQRTEPLPLCELQARWVSLVYSGKLSLPTEAQVYAWEKQREVMSKAAKIPDRFWHRVDYPVYMDFMAEKIGCLPSVLEWQNSNWEMFKELMWNPMTPPQYRLTGPGSNREEAAKLLKKIWE